MVSVNSVQMDDTENSAIATDPGMLPYRKEPLPDTGGQGADDVAGTSNLPAVRVRTLAGSTEANEQSFINALNPDNTLVTSPSASYWTYEGATARKWGSSTIGTMGGTVTYYFAPSSNFTVQEQATIKEGFALWSAETNINFVQTTTSSSANVLLQRGSRGSGEYFSDEGHVTAGSGSTDGTYNGQTLINFDTGTAGFELTGSFSTYGGYGVGSMVHEMGHLIGLGHGGPYNGSVNPSTQQYSAYDSRLWSIMSYIEPDDSSAKYYNSYPVKGTNWGYDTAPDGDTIQTSTTPMPLDILAAQQIYGVPTGGPLSGGQTFGFNTNIDPSIRNFFDFTVNTKPVVTLFDTGTNNTLNLSGFSTASKVNLSPGTFSSTSGQTNNIGIAYGTVIDHVVGGSAADTFTGTARAETFTGGGGADTFTGGGGADLYKDTGADLNGDTITDFIGLDTIDVTDAVGAVMDLTLSGTTLSFMDGMTSVAMTLDGAAGQVEQKVDATNGGVDIYFALPTPPPPATPTVSGLSPVTTALQLAMQPFASATVSDPTSGAQDSVTIAPSGAAGVLAGAGLTANPDGTYTLAFATPQTVTQELDALTFTPSIANSGPVEATSFALTITSTSGASGTASSSYTVNSTPNQGEFGTTTTSASSPQGEVYTLYEGLLGRAPDPTGGEQAVADLQAGASLGQLTQGILASPEGSSFFTPGSTDSAFVDQLYARVLGRTPDAAGDQTWVTALMNGESRADVADSFVFSAEHLNDIQPALSQGVFVADAATSGVARLYYGLLDRSPDAGGLAANTGQIASTMSLQALAQSFLNSPEYAADNPVPPSNAAFVGAIYSDALGRAPDPSGGAYWTNQLDSGADTRAQVAVGIAESPEAVQHLAGRIEAGFHIA